MVARNDITGDAIQTKTVSDKYRSNYDNIFNKKKHNENIVEKGKEQCKNCSKCNEETPKCNSVP